MLKFVFTSILTINIIFNIHAQDSIQPVLIKASDPTQLYNFVETNLGMNFYHRKGYGFEPEAWATSFRGNFAMNKFRIGVFIPISNYNSATRLIGDVKLDFGFQLHNNSGIYNSTLLNFGLSFAARNERQFDFSNPVESSTDFTRFFVNYIGAVKFNSKWSIYPTAEAYLKYKSMDSRPILPDSTYLGPEVFQTGIKFGGLFSFDWNESNFIQFGGGWSKGNWGSNDEKNYLSKYTENTWFFSLKYQHSFNQHSQLYFLITDKVLAIEENGIRNYNPNGVMRFRIGYKFFLR